MNVIAIPWTFLIVDAVLVFTLLTVVGLVLLLFGALWAPRRPHSPARPAPRGRAMRGALVVREPRGPLSRTTGEIALVQGQARAMVRSRR